MRSLRAAPGKNSLSVTNQDLEPTLLHHDLNDIFQYHSYSRDYAVIFFAFTHRNCQKLQHTDIPNLISEASI